MNETTLAVIKPGAVKRKKVGEILTYIESLDDLKITSQGCHSDNTITMFLFALPPASFIICARLISFSFLWPNI